METAVFIKKLNYVEGKSYPIEERIEMPESGTYEGMLQHDNIDEATLRVYTGPGMTGNLVQAFVLSTPSLTPWKRNIRIYSAEPVVYIRYETDGDTVEADDVNILQDEILRTQAAVGTQERRLADTKTGLEDAMKDLKESIQGISKTEIDALDGIVPEEGMGGMPCGCGPLTAEEIDEVTPGGGIPSFAYDPLTREEIEEATK